MEAPGDKARCDDVTHMTGYNAELGGRVRPRDWLLPGGPYAGLAPQYRFTLEDEWYPDKPMNGNWAPPLYPTGMLADYFKKMAEEKWPLTINVVISQDVKASHHFVNPASLAEMVAVRKAVRGQ